MNGFLSKPIVIGDLVQEPKFAKNPTISHKVINKINLPKVVTNLVLGLLWGKLWVHWG